jgi:hypothetical protein
MSDRPRLQEAGMANEFEAAAERVYEAAKEFIERHEHVREIAPGEPDHAPARDARYEALQRLAGYVDSAMPERRL